MRFNNIPFMKGGILEGLLYQTALVLICVCVCVLVLMYSRVLMSAGQNPKDVFPSCDEQPGPIGRLILTPLCCRRVLLWKRGAEGGVYHHAPPRFPLFPRRDAVSVNRRVPKDQAQNYSPTPHQPPSPPHHHHHLVQSVQP